MYSAQMLLRPVKESECFIMMDTIKVNSLNSKMVAHRGVSGIETENTMSAFVAAGNRSYFGIECDVHVTGDKKFVVIHDETTARVSDMDINVEEASFEEVRGVVLKNKEHTGKISDMPTTRGDLIIPSLAEYISVCKKYNKKCVLELKNHFEIEDLKAAVEEIKSIGYLDGVIFISFDAENCINIRKMLPSQEVEFLCATYNDDVLAMLNEYDIDLDIAHGALTKEIIDEVHKNGHLVNCWTVDDKERAEELAAWGADFITSNILE